MPHIVGKECIECKYGDCVEVCPVDCFFEGELQLFIHPNECIDCGACVPHCPVGAIKPDFDAEQEATDLNKNFEYKDDLRKTAKEDISHGSKFDPNIS